MTLLAGWLEREMGERALFLGAVEFQVARELRRLPRPARRSLLSLFRRARPGRSRRIFWELDPATGAWRLLA